MKSYKLILVVIAFSFSWNLFAQENLWYEKKLSAYTEYLFKEFGIDCKVPEKFTELNKYYVMWKVRKDPSKHTGNIYGPIFQSKNKECILMFPALPHYVSEEDIKRGKTYAKIERILNRDTSTVEPNVGNNNTFPRGQISGEIKTALGLYYSYAHPLNNDTTKFDFNDYVTIVAGKKAREMFNADSIYIYEIPGADSVYFFDESLEKMRKRKYPYCTSVFIRKDSRATIDFKLFLTKRGKKNEEKYIDLLSKQVWYDENFKHE
ncbi:MAG: hypothetical protein AB2L24_01020 [Mangrovibacterium sp.]